MAFPTIPAGDMSGKLVTKPFQNLLCETCGQKVNVSTGEGYWRVDPSNSPWKVLAWHTDCKLEDDLMPDDAETLVAWVREAADELEKAHHILDEYVDRKRNGIAMTLAARIAVMGERVE